MFKGLSILAVIPAKGKSSRLPAKNMKLFLGKPLILWTILEAKKSRFLDTIVVSTESNEITKIALRFGADVPFKRPLALTGKQVSAMDVVRHAVTWFKGNGRHFDLAMLLQPTSPLRTAKEIDRALEYFLKKDADGLISVIRPVKPPLWLKVINKNGYLEDFFENQSKEKVKDLSFYMPNGAIYIMKTKALLSKRKCKVVPYFMDNNSSVDIDEPLEFKIAQWLMLERLGYEFQKIG